jgi:Response regulator containing CheY-like receiver domain and AraC-type DNA-binding domain
MKIKFIELPFKQKNNNYFSNILVSFTLWTAAIVILLSTILYVNFEKIYLTMLQSSIRNELSQISYSSSFMTETAKRLASQIYFDPQASKLFYNYPLGSYEVNIAINQINSYKANYPYIYSVYVYNSYYQTFYTTLNNCVISNQKDFFDKEVIGLMKSPDVNAKLLPIPHRIPGTFPLNPQTSIANVYTYIFHNLTNLRSGNVVILNISQEWIREMIQALDKNSADNTYIIDNKGILVSSNIKANVFTDMSKYNYVQDILKSDSNTGYFVQNVDGVKTLITYVSAEEALGWKFIRITPYSMIMDKISRMKNMTIFISLLILFIGFTISIFISKKLYKPFNGLLYKMNKLNSEIRNEQKQEFLRALLHNKYDYQNPSLQRDFDKFDIKMDVQSYFMLIIIKIDHYERFCNQFNCKDRDLYKFAILNIASELCGEKFTNVTVDTSEDNMVMLLSSPAIQDSLDAELENILKNIQLNVEKYFQISLSITVSNFEKDVYNMGDLYNQTLALSKYRIFKGHRCILYPESIRASNLTEYIYPLEKEKKLIDSLLLGKTADVKTIYLNIISDAAKSSYINFNSTLLRVVIAVNTGTSMIEKNNTLFLSNNLNDFISKLNSMETLEEINLHFFSIFDLISENLKENKSVKYDKLISQIIAKIDKDFTDQNLTRESLADSVNMSPGYLGQLFKNSTSKSISDYINDKRIEKAKELLISSKYTVNEIVEKIGYINVSYFCTFFKKLNGITPNEYRKNFSTHT